MEPVIRPAQSEDTPLILEFIRCLADYERLATEMEASEERLRASLFPDAGPPAAYCLLAFATDAQGKAAPAGFAVYFFTFSTFLARPGLYLEDLYVHPRFRGGGIGAALLLRAARIANERGCGRMEWAVLDWNEPAIAFYERLGAQRLPQWQLCRLSEEALRRYA